MYYCFPSFLTYSPWAGWSPRFVLWSWECPPPVLPFPTESWITTRPVHCTVRSSWLETMRCALSSSTSSYCAFCDAQWDVSFGWRPFHTCCTHMGALQCESSDAWWGASSAGRLFRSPYTGRASLQCAFSGAARWLSDHWTSFHTPYIQMVFHHYEFSDAVWGRSSEQTLSHRSDTHRASLLYGFFYVQKSIWDSGTFCHIHCTGKFGSLCEVL